MGNQGRNKSTELLANAFLVVATGLLGVILWRVIFTDSDIPVSSVEAEATAVANERLFQLAQWTIGSVLTIGIALIGFNWVQTKRDRDEVKESLDKLEQMSADLKKWQDHSATKLTSESEKGRDALAKRQDEFEVELSSRTERTNETLSKRQDEFESSIRERLAAVEVSVQFSWDANMGLRLLDQAKQERYPLDPNPGYFIRKFQIPGVQELEKRTLAQLVLYALEMARGKGNLSSQDLDELRAFLPELMAYDEVLGRLLSQALWKAGRETEDRPVAPAAHDEALSTE